MPTIDAEGMLYLFDRHESGLVAAEDLLAEATAHEIEAGHARLALRDLVLRGTLELSAGNKLRRPD